MVPKPSPPHVPADGGEITRRRVTAILQPIAPDFLLDEAHQCCTFSHGELLVQVFYAYADHVVVSTSLMHMPQSGGRLMEMTAWANSWNAHHDFGTAYAVHIDRQDSVFPAVDTVVPLSGGASDAQLRQWISWAITATVNCMADATEKLQLT